MKNALVILKGKKALTTSEIIARETKIQHKNVLERIKKYENRILRFGTLAFETRKSKGKPTKIYHLNEPQALFLITLMENNDIVLNFKEALVKEFFNMRQWINSVKNMTSTEEWQKIRKESKDTRFEETYEIKKFTNYAKANGSKNSEKYYKHFTSLLYNTLFIVQDDYKDMENKKNYMNTNQLLVMMQGEYIIKNKINEYVEKEIEYHEIYRNIRNDIKNFSNFIEITKIPHFEQLSLFC